MPTGDFAEQLRQAGYSSRTIRPGHVYQLPDSVISFPEANLPRQDGKGVHVSRYAIVVQADESLDDPTHKRVIVVPTSESSLHRKVKPRYGIPLDKGDGNLPTDCLALVDHVQPVLKTHLKHYCGELSAKKFEELQAVLLLILGQVPAPS